KVPVFDDLAIHQWKVTCDSCAAELNFEFMLESKLGVKAQKPAAIARIAELRRKTEGEKHMCKKTHQQAA
ncbi:hypothetical protein RA281_29705, partial [Pseudomonas syringae pv. tagetis]